MNFLASAQALVFFALSALVLGMCVYALVDAARRPAAAFTAAGKRTKNFWLVVLGVAAAIAFASLGGIGFLAIIAAVAAGVYLADVKPAITPYSGRGGSGGSGPRGGW